MANFTAADVKALREQTGAGMMDVKKALTEADGDAEKALEIIRLKGLKSLSKREGRQASAGLLAAQTDGTVGVLVEVNSETDFVAKNQKFIDFSNEVLAAAVASGAASTPDASAEFSGRVLEAEYRTSALTGQRFIHVSVDAAFPFDVCLPDGELPQRDSVIAGTAVMAGSIPTASGGGCGGCGGSCGCGGH